MTSYKKGWLFINTLKIESKLAEKYKYKKLPSDLSEKYRQFFKDNIPDKLNINGGGRLKTLNGSAICENYRRIVVGDYGAFIEFDNPSNSAQFVVAPGQEYRVNDERYSKNVKYIWLTIADGSNIKIYQQKRSVTYADYIPGMYYVSVHEVVPEEVKYNDLFMMSGCPGCDNLSDCLSLIDKGMMVKCIFWGELVKYRDELSKIRS